MWTNWQVSMRKINERERLVNEKCYFYCFDVPRPHKHTAQTKTNQRCRLHPKDIKNILAQQPFETVSTHMHMWCVCVCISYSEKVFSVYFLALVHTGWHYAYHCEQLFLMANSRQNINIMTPQFLHGQMTQRHSTMIHFPTENRIEYRSTTLTW